MVFKISDDIVKIAETADADSHQMCIDIINQLGRAYKRGLHFLFADKVLLRRITEIPYIDHSARNVYSHIVDTKYNWLKAVVKDIRFHVLITTERESIQDDSAIILNPKDFPDYYFESPLNLICENILDADFYKIVGKVVAKHNRFSSDLNIMFNNDAGNGSNTVQKIEFRHRENNNLFLAILDSDRHFFYSDIETVPIGDTAKSVKCYFRDTENDIVLGKYYILQNVSEIENLIPIESVKKLKRNLGDVKNISQDARCWYDMKKGVSCKHVKKGEKCREYWQGVFAENALVKDRITQAANCPSECKDCKKPMNITTNFGASLLEDILNDNSCKALLYEKNMSSLSHNQRLEWDHIGKLMIEWCCAPPKIRV